jgi:hypothetical protein
MRFTLTIDCDNAAFGDNDATERAAEVSYILRVVAQEFDNGTPADDIRVRDSNGNRVGTAAFSDSED